MKYYGSISDEFRMCETLIIPSEEHAYSADIVRNVQICFFEINNIVHNRVLSDQDIVIHHRSFDLSANKLLEFV